MNVVRRISLMAMGAVFSDISAQRVETDHIPNDIEESDRYPIAPEECFASAVNGGGGAVVWWIPKASKLDITTWEVHRYRYDEDTKEWKHKVSLTISHIDILITIKIFQGFNVFTNESKVYRVHVEGLSNGYDYRFTIRAQYVDDVSFNHSPVSNTIFVDKPLPSWWLRLYDHVETHQFYYLNAKTLATSWNRPETEKFFLEDIIHSNFNQRELDNLRNIYDNEVFHYDKLDALRMQSVLLELGDRMRKYAVLDLIQEYTGGEKAVSSWLQFMVLIDHVKRLHQEASLSAERMRMDADSRMKKLISFQCCWHSEHKPHTIGGPWVREWRIVARRHCFRNIETGTVVWDVPEEVRVHLTPDIEQRLLKRFEHDSLDLFRAHFIWADLDMSGSLSPVGFWTLLEKLHIHVEGDITRRLLYRTVDRNRNGKIEFNELCYFMYKLNLKFEERKGFWKALPDYSELDLSTNVTLPLYYLVYHQDKLGNANSTDGALAASKISAEVALAEMKNQQLKLENRKRTLFARTKRTVSFANDSIWRGFHGCLGWASRSTVFQNRVVGVAIVDNMGAFPNADNTGVERDLDHIVANTDHDVVARNKGEIDKIHGKKEKKAHGLGCMCGCRAFALKTAPKTATLT